MRRQYLGLFWFAILAASAALSGCNAVITAFESPSLSTPAPTPEVLTVAIAPEARPLWGNLHACALFHPEIALLLWERPSTSPEFHDADLSIRLGGQAEDSSYTALLGETEIVVIVNPGSPLEALSDDEVRTIFQQGVGSSGQPMQVWILQNSDVRQVFDKVVLSEAKITPQARIAPDPAAMVAEVSADPTAIGYIPATWVNDKVRSLDLDDDLSVKLGIPILAISPEEPQGNLRIFLGCVQKVGS